MLHESIEVARGEDLPVKGHCAPVARHLDHGTVAVGKILHRVALEEDWPIERYRRGDTLAEHDAIPADHAAHSEGPVSRRQGEAKTSGAEICADVAMQLYITGMTNRLRPSSGTLDTK